MTPVDRAHAIYAGWCDVLAMHCYCDPTPCGLCGVISLQLDAASIASDNAVAEWFAGRYPRLWSKEIPG